MSRIKQLIMMSVLIVAAMALVGFAIDRQHDRACETFEVHFMSPVASTSLGMGDLEFVREHEIKQGVRDRGDAIIGQTMSDIRTEAIEQSISSNPFVKSATVYKTIDLGVEVVIEQRVPVFRFISDRGASGYVDTDGNYMPMRAGYSPKMVPVTGNLPVSAANMENGSVVGDSTMTDLWEMMKTIGADEFWRSQFVQLDVAPNGELTAIPRVGNHVIIFGDASDHEVKLARLKAFYEKGVGQTNWNIYESINVKFEDQVVCKKRQYK